MWTQTIADIIEARCLILDFSEAGTIIFYKAEKKSIFFIDPWENVRIKRL